MIPKCNWLYRSARLWMESKQWFVITTTSKARWGGGVGWLGSMCALAEKAEWWWVFGEGEGNTLSQSSFVLTESLNWADLLRRTTGWDQTQGHYCSRWMHFLYYISSACRAELNLTSPCFLFVFNFLMSDVNVQKWHAEVVKIAGLQAHSGSLELVDRLFSLF